MLTIGPLTFHLYGLLIGLGVLAGAWVASRKEPKIWDAILWVIGGGIIGARAYHVIDLWSYYRINLIEIPAVWHGGMGIFGGILGGIIGLWIYVRVVSHPVCQDQATPGVEFRRLLDLAALGLPLGQAIGRWGNYFNQELYGQPTNLPWGIFIRPENRLIQVIDFEKFHPLFLYESLWCLGIFLILKKLNFKPGSGRTLAVYLGLYGLGRFGLEFLRIAAWQINGINVAQAISAGLVAGSIGYLWIVKK